ncbi:MAG: 30S ribosomal protein S4 [Alistipes putredinis]|nr:MAG: 30S ribosomal protein S4 [Alistipes putredinis]
MRIPFSKKKKTILPDSTDSRASARKTSEYGVQLSARNRKPKLFTVFLEKQFYITYERAARLGGITGENLLKLLECRLDNVVYRLGIAPTRAAARQLVSHRHITVNGQVVNIPSYSLKAGDVVGVREKSKKSGSHHRLACRRTQPLCLVGVGRSYDDRKNSFKKPEREDIPEKHQGAAHRRIVL